VTAGQIAGASATPAKALDAEPGNHMTDRLLEYVNYDASVVAKNYSG